MNLPFILRSLIISIILSLIGVFCLGSLHPELFPQGAMDMFASVDTVLFFVLIFTGGLVATITGSSSGHLGAEAGQLDDSNYSTRETGAVKWFNASKGFGFITRDDGTDVFVHYRSIRGEGRRTLYEGQQVRFDTSEGEKGLQADDVEIV